jgi:WD40 repeat protein
VFVSFDGHYAGTPYSLSFSPDGRTLASARPDGSIQIRQVPTCDVLATLPSDGAELLSLRFDPDGNRLAAAYRNERILLFSLNGEAPEELNLDVCPWAMDFRPDGAKLAVACWGGGQIQVWDLATRTLDLRLEEPKAVVWDVAYMPANPAILASCSDDGTVALWDLQWRQNLLKVEPFHDRSAITVSFTPDGGMLVGAGADGSVCLWDLEYFERHMVGNLHFQMEILRPELGDAIQADYLTTWSRKVMNRAWPRIGPYAQEAPGGPAPVGTHRGVDPLIISRWGRGVPSRPIP